MTVSLDVSLFDLIVDGAADESSLWAVAAREPGARDTTAVFSTLVCDPLLALGVETIYEGYVVHYGTSRLFDPADRDDALLLGDYLYAHGLVRIAATGNRVAVNDLAELISLCAQLRADTRPGDGPAWAATAAQLGEGRLGPAREALRDRADVGPLLAAARSSRSSAEIDAAFATHARLLPSR